MKVKTRKSRKIRLTITPAVAVKELQFIFYKKDGNTQVCKGVDVDDAQRRARIENSELEYWDYWYGDYEVKK